MACVKKLHSAGFLDGDFKPLGRVLLPLSTEHSDNENHRILICGKYRRRPVEYFHSRGGLSVASLSAAVALFEELENVVSYINEQFHREQGPRDPKQVKSLAEDPVSRLDLSAGDQSSIVPSKSKVCYQSSPFWVTG